MGWLFTAHQRKAELVRERTAPWQTEEVRGTTLAHGLRRQCLWKVVEIEHQASGAKERYIALDLLAYHSCSWYDGIVYRLRRADLGELLTEAAP